jgi:CRP-like cAMP-binding protein
VNAAGGGGARPARRPHLPEGDVNPTLKKLEAAFSLSAEEKDYLRDLQGAPRSIRAGRQIVVEGGTYKQIFFLIDGWAFRSKVLPDGRRQIFSYLIPGDLIGLRASLMEFADDTVEALTDCEVSSFSLDRLYETCQTHPRLAVALMWSAAREQSMLSEQVMRIGRRNAVERVAHFFLELLRRLQLVDEAGRRSFELPLTQELIADTLGLSIVHVNRTLRTLRQRGLVEIVEGRLVIHDVDKLSELASFDPLYLGQATRLA